MSVILLRGAAALRKRVEEEVACRVEQELERRREEIEDEVERRVAAAKLEMEVGLVNLPFMFYQQYMQLR